jgi:sialic acid synthase SpsE
MVAFALETVTYLETMAFIFYKIASETVFKLWLGQIICLQSLPSSNHHHFAM